MEVRLGQLIDLSLLKDLLDEGAFLAGGAVVFVLIEKVSINSVGDVDVFISDEIKFRKCAKMIAEHKKM